MMEGFDFGLGGDGSFAGDNERWTAPQSTGGGTSSQLETRQLEQRLERLTLICHAMWSLLQEQTSLGEQQLLQRVHELQRNGEQEGGQGPEQCPKCGRTFNRRQDKCLYCGEPKPATSAFDLV